MNYNDFVNLNRSTEYYTALHTNCTYSTFSSSDITANPVCVKYVAFESAHKESIPIYTRNDFSYDTLEMDHPVYW